LRCGSGSISRSPDIDVQLKQRHDLIPNLVETVKAYASHERGTLEAVIQARKNTAIAAPGVEQKVAAETCLSGALRQIFALSEAYPDLKANTNFQQLQSELSDIENKLGGLAALLQQRRSRNTNTGIQNFPAVLFAAMLGFARSSSSISRDPRPGRAGAAGEVLVPPPQPSPASGGGSALSECMEHAYGLYTHIQSNRRRSVLLLVGLFFLVYVMVFAGALVAEAMTNEASIQWLFAAGPSTMREGLAVRHRRHGDLGLDRLQIPPVDDRRGNRRAGGHAGDQPRLYNLLENLCISRGIRCRN